MPGRNVTSSTSIVFGLHCDYVRQKVGSLTPNSTQTHWFTQMVYLTGGQLNNGNNELQLEAVSNDSFEIKDVTCFFGQSA